MTVEECKEIVRTYLAYCGYTDQGPIGAGLERAWAEAEAKESPAPSAKQTKTCEAKDCVEPATHTTKCQGYFCKSHSEQKTAAWFDETPADSAHAFTKPEMDEIEVTLNGLLEMSHEDFSRVWDALRPDQRERICGAQPGVYGRVSDCPRAPESLPKFEFPKLPFVGILSDVAKNHLEQLETVLKAHLEWHEAQPCEGGDDGTDNS